MQRFRPARHDSAERSLHWRWASRSCPMIPHLKGRLQTRDFEVHFGLAQWHLTATDLTATEGGQRTECSGWSKQVCSWRFRLSHQEQSCKPNSELLCSLPTFG